MIGAGPTPVNVANLQASPYASCATASTPSRPAGIEHSGHPAAHRVMVLPVDSPEFVCPRAYRRPVPRRVGEQYIEDRHGADRRLRREPRPSPSRSSYNRASDQIGTAIWRPAEFERCAQADEVDRDGLKRRTLGHAGMLHGVRVDGHLSDPGRDQLAVQQPAADSVSARRGLPAAWDLLADGGRSCSMTSRRSIEWHGIVTRAAVGGSDASS